MLNNIRTAIAEHKNEIITGISVAASIGIVASAIDTIRTNRYIRRAAKHDVYTEIMASLTSLHIGADAVEGNAVVMRDLMLEDADAPAESIESVNKIIASLCDIRTSVQSLIMHQTEEEYSSLMLQRIGLFNQALTALGVLYADAQDVNYAKFLKTWSYYHEIIEDINILNADAENRVIANTKAAEEAAVKASKEDLKEEPTK